MVLVSLNTVSANTYNLYYLLFKFFIKELIVRHMFLLPSNTEAFVIFGNILCDFDKKVLFIFQVIYLVGKLSIVTISHFINCFEIPVIKFK